MAVSGNWTILGSNPIAEALTRAAGYVDVSVPVTIATEPEDVPDDAFAIGPAILTSSVERVAPYYCAFEAIEQVERQIRTGEIGTVYGCFASFRIPRTSTPHDVRYAALLPVVAVALDLLRSPVRRVHAQRASLLSHDDAWFVMLRLADETIVTIEALAVLDPDAGLTRDLLVEVTGAERVLRAEPMRQAVVVERTGHAPMRHQWWEDANERFLRLVATRAEQPPAGAGTRLRQTWQAIDQSAQRGAPIDLTS